MSIWITRSARPLLSTSPAKNVVPLSSIGPVHVAVAAPSELPVPGRTHSVAVWAVGGTTGVGVGLGSGVGSAVGSVAPVAVGSVADTGAPITAVASGAGVAVG